MNNCQNANRMNRLMTIIAFVIVAILFCAVILIPTDVAEAETKVGLFDNAPNWQEIYDGYTERIADDWYFDEQYLDLYNAIIEASKMVNDSAFNKEALKNDPIVIALIDTGISAVYDATGAYDGARCGITQTFINPIEVEYRVHPIFEDVLLTDKNGNYVYYVSAENFTYESANGTITTIDWFNTGNIAQDMISFDDHGVGVTGIVAYLIHQFGLEDYIKIMPIKADDRYFRTNGVLQLAYSVGTLDNAVQWAYDHGADIVNASFSTSATSKCMSLAKDILVVGAAGNSNSNKLNYPSGHVDVLGVMNYVKDEDGNLVVYARDAGESYGSTYGEWYDVVAPGETLIIPCYGRNVADYCSYKIMGGTSSSAPVASFASALAMMRYRGYDNYGVDFVLTTRFVKEMIPYCSDQVATRVDDNGIVHKFPALDLKNVLTFDFYGDIAFLEKIGVDVDNMLSVSSNAHSKHMVGETITLTADTNPVGISNGKTIGWWYQLNGKTYQIGFGNEIQFKIPEKVGTYKIYSAFVDEQGDAYLESANTIDFEVRYPLPTSVDIVADIDDEYKVGDNAKVLLEIEMNLTTSYTDDLIWWYEFNGVEYPIGTGMTTEFDIPNDVGTYVIKCAFEDENGLRYAYCTNPVEFAVTYYAVESISINGNIDNEYKVDNTESVELSVSVNPTNAHIDGTFVWTVECNGEVVDTINGQSVNIDIPNKVGTYKVYCNYGNIQSTNHIEFAVEYYDHADVKWDVQATTSTDEKLMIGDVVNITIQGIQLYDPAIVNEIEWRVNNVNVAKGAEFSWPIYASGQYKIYAKVAGTEYLIAEFVVVAETQSTPIAPDPDPNPEPEPPVIDDNGDNAMTTVIAVLSVVAVAGVGTSIAIAVMARKKSKKSK